MRRWLALALLLVSPLVARANDESDVLRARGALLAAEGNCAEAIPLFQRALAADPKQARAGLMLGRCQIAAKQYAEAEATLGQAVQRDPSLSEAQLELAIARYHQDNYAGARTALDAARPTQSGEARFQLYEGLVLLREGKRSEGIAALERARQIDPKQVEPTASYIAGLALQNEGDRTQARDAMERVIATARGRGAARRAARSVGAHAVPAQPRLLGRADGRRRVGQQRGAARRAWTCRPTSPTRRTGAGSGTRTPATSS